MTRFSGLPLARREDVFRKMAAEKGFDMPQPQYAILWEDPNDMDKPLQITVPTPATLGMAVIGGILPPSDAFNAIYLVDGKTQNGHFLHESPPMGALSEEQFMEWLVRVAVPPSVWRDYRGNRSILKIVPRDHIRTKDTYRNAWRLPQ